MADNNTVILRVQLDEGKTEDKLKQLVLDLEATTKAQAALRVERKAGTISDEEFAKQSVALKTQLTGQRAEQTALTKNLELYRTAVNDTGGTYKGLQAQLSLAQRQFQQLDGSADNSTESAKALGSTIDELRNTLKATDATQSLFVRNLGNYPKTDLTPLIQQLVRLEEIQKSGTLTAEQAAEADRAAVGYKQQIAQAGAAEGKSYEQTTNLVKQYGDAIRPATQALIKLEEEQRQVVDSGQATGEEVAQIGFRFGQAKKQIQDATDALKQEAKAAASTSTENKTLSGGLKEVASQNSLVASATEKYTGVKEKYTQATNLAKLAIGGEVTALGLLRVAILATGLGALVLVLGAVVTFLTKTAEGTRLVENVMAQVGAIVNVVTDRFGAFGKAVTQVLSGDFSGAAATAKTALSGIGDEVARETKLAGDLSRAQQQLNKDRQANADTNKRLLRDEENLKNIRDNEFNTLAVRRKANEDAFAVEQKREATLVDLAQRQLAIYRQQIAARGGREKADKESLDKLAENELADIQEDAAGRRNEYITNRFQLVKDGLDKEKEATDKALEKRLQLRKDALALEAQLIERQLKTTQNNSDQELSLLQQKLRNGYQAELNVKNLTASAKKVIDAKYENDSLALTLDFNRRRLLAALQAATDTTAAELAQQRTGSDEALRLQAQQIEQQRVLSLAGLTASADNTAKIDAINAAAAAQQRQVEYANATQQLAEYLDQKRQAVELDYAKGLIQEGEYQRQLAALTTAGIQAQAVVNEDYQQDNRENRKQATEDEIAQARRATEATKLTEKTKQDIKEATLQAAINHTDTLISLFGEESAAGQAAMAIKKVLGLAEIALNLQKELAANKLAGAQLAAFIPPPAGIALGTAYTIAADAVSITAAAAGAAAILKLQRGGIADGPSHQDGGIPLYYRGRPAGIEIEGGEPVLTRGVTQNPLLLSLASTVNQLAGGRPLVPNFPVPRMALGGVTVPLAQQQLRGPEVSASPAAIGAEVAKALRKSPPRAIISDVKAGLGRDAFTEAQSNS
jgi:hypothetical protein